MISAMVLCLSVCCGGEMFLCSFVELHLNICTRTGSGAALTSLLLTNLLDTSTLRLRTAKTISPRVMSFTEHPLPSLGVERHVSGLIYEHLSIQIARIFQHASIGRYHGCASGRLLSDSCISFHIGVWSTSLKSFSSEMFLRSLWTIKHIKCKADHDVSVRHEGSCV
jgi:hypothetical protein